MNRIFYLLILLIGFPLSLLSSELPATEVRAVWLTTNYGLDWPHNRTSREAQQNELIAILDSLKRHHFNTVLFQVRGRGEVLYRSKIEPMSSLVVTGGNSSSAFDPLAFAIEECHKRGLECHAWIVTYPLGSDKQVKSLGNASITRKQPSLARKFQGEWYLDPGNPRTDEYLLSIVQEIVTGYDVDGIHFDYIRYPDNKGRFPDDTMYRLHGKGKSRADWRRDNITRFVTRVYDWIKQEKPWVQVSSAPLGRYRAIGDNGHGWTAMETVYQDAGRWMQAGKHDALYPMMYYKDHLFYPFVDDWMINGNKRIVVPGLGVYQMIELDWSRNDILEQVDYTRSREVQGQAYFRSGNLLSNTKGILTAIEAYYRYPAKLPPMTWLSDTIPATPADLRAERASDGLFELRWQAVGEESRVTYNLYRSDSDDFNLNRAENLLSVGLREPVYRIAVADDDKAYYYYVTVSDSYHNESAPSTPAFFYHSTTLK